MENILNQIESTVQQALDGEVCEFTTLAIVKSIIDFCEIKKNQLNSACLNIMSRNNEKEFSKNGFTYQMSSRSTFDFKADSEWQALKKQLSERENKLKSVYEVVMQNGTTIDTGTGEEIQPPSKNTSEFIIIKKQK